MTHFWPDYTALIAELRAGAGAGSHAARTTNGLFSRAADALEAERRVRMEEYAIAKHLRIETLTAKERAEAERDETKKAASLLDNEAFTAMGQTISTLTAERDKAFAAQDRSEEWGYKQAQDIMMLGQEIGRLTAERDEALAEVARLTAELAKAEEP